MTATVHVRRPFPIRRALILLPIAAIITWFAFALALSGIARKTDPQLALEFMPNEATALATRADQLLFATPESASSPNPEVKALALEALRQQAINPPALRALGYQASTIGQVSLARTFIRLSAHQSPRDGGAQLWLIEDAVSRGDVQEALLHYDIVLRTRPSTQALLFPILLSAIDDPVIRKALVPYISTDRLWVQTFMTYANSASSDPRALVELITESGGFGDPTVAHRLNLELLTRLVSEKRFADARRLFGAMPGARKASLVDPRFEKSDREARFGPMGWQTVNNPESSSSFTVDDSGKNILLLLANSATTATVASRLLYLQPGEYNVAAQLAGAPSSDDGSIRWQLRCPMLGERPIWAMESRAAQSIGKLTVPTGCATQYFDIVVSGGAGQTGLEASVVEIRLRRN